MSMRELIRSGTKWDFLGKRYFAFLLSALLIAGSIYLWISQGSSKYGIDFLGGNEIVVDIQGETSPEALVKLLEGAGVDGPVVQSFEAASRDYSIRLGGEANAARAVVQSTLQGAFPGQFEILRTEFVGPTIGDELKRKALIALLVGLVGMLIYVSVRFEFAYALGGVVAIFHDVLIATGAYLAVGHQLNMASVAAALTIVGYSLNDTIVIFDRLREERLKRPKADLYDLTNEVMNAMLGRTIITSLLTLFTALSLLLLGGGAIADLSVYLVAGIICGSYSTIYLAAPVVLAWERFRAPKRSVAAQQA